MNAYPSQYKNLLIKADLLGMPGIKEVRGLVLEPKLKEFDEVSQTFRDSPVPEVDHRRTSEYYAPIATTGDKVEGDWRIGLTAEEIRIIHEECGVPIFTKSSRLFLHHGKMFDMENPQHVAEYRILETQNLVAEGPKLVGSGQRYFWHDQATEQKAREEARKQRRVAIELDETLTDEEKRSLLKLVNYERKLGISSDLNAVMMRESFADIAYNRPGDLVAVSEMDNGETRLLLHELVSAGILYKEGDKGTISRPTGAKLADTFDEAVYLLVTDSALRFELENKLGAKTGYGMATPKPAVKGRPEMLKRYDTVVHEEKAVNYWNKEACMQYFADNNIEVKLTEADGVERWRQLVIKAHRREDSPDFVTPNVDRTAFMVGDIKGRVADWNKVQCVAFMNEHQEFLKERGYEEEIAQKDGIMRARKVVSDALAMCTEDEITALMDGETPEPVAGQTGE